MEYKEGQKKGTRNEKGGWVLVKLPGWLVVLLNAFEVKC